MKKLTCTIFLTVTALHLAVANDATEAAKPAEPSTEAASTENARTTPPAIELKNRSDFAVENSSRNPFWPIGWKPAAKVTNNATETSGPEVSPTAFVVTSIMMGQGTHFAIINGKPMQEGQVFGLQMGNQVYQITVKTIEDGQVLLQRRDQEIAVPLRRR